MLFSLQKAQKLVQSLYEMLSNIEKLARKELANTKKKTTTIKKKAASTLTATKKAIKKATEAATILLNKTDDVDKLERGLKLFKILVNNRKSLFCFNRKIS